MNPKHHNPIYMRYDKKTDNESWAYAPYNFVPLPEKVIRVENPPNQDIYSDNTGYITCTLTTESPLYIRGAMSPEFFSKYGDGETPFEKLPDDQKKERTEFFHRDNNKCPVIPGSSLRGMVRTLVEIAGYGKMQWVTDDLKITYRAVAAPRNDPLATPYDKVIGRSGNNVLAGYLVKNSEDWYIQPAKKPSDLSLPDRRSYLQIRDRIITSTDIPSFLNFNDPSYMPQYHDVSFDIEIRDGKGGKFTQITNIGTANAGYKYRGVIVCSGNMLESGSNIPSPREKHALVLEKNRDVEKVRISKQGLKNYIEGLTSFQKEAPFDKKKGCLIEGRPIFYVPSGGEVLFFGHSPNFRIPAIISKDNRIVSPLDFVPEGIRNENEIDMADAIFGYIHGNVSKITCAGRVFFTDAKLESARNGIWLSQITPKVLASPKPTTFQHYLVQDKLKNHDPDDKKQLAHYATPSPKETVIRGHKMYWHKKEVDLDDIKENDQKKTEKSPSQYTQIMPIKDGVTFSFRIYFENLRNYELGALLWVLSLPNEYRLKLGMGKPLGMGSIKIESKLYRSIRRDRYKCLFDADRWAESINPDTNIQNVIDDFKKFVFSKINSDDKGTAKNFDQLDRIQVFLKMLEWPGPDNELTRYLEIKRLIGNEFVNEYKERAVLPDPFHIEPP